MSTYENNQLITFNPIKYCLFSILESLAQKVFMKDEYDRCFYMFWNQRHTFTGAFFLRLMLDEGEGLSNFVCRRITCIEVWKAIFDLVFSGWQDTRSSITSSSCWKRGQAIFRSWYNSCFFQWDSIVTPYFNYWSENSWVSTSGQLGNRNRF